MRFNDLMIDLETLGKTPAAAILSIGATFFDLETGQLGETFYRVLDIDSACQHGTMDGATIQWWIQQSGAAKQLFADFQKKHGFTRAMSDFMQFLLGECDPYNLRVWGNGASFDIPIIEHAIRQTQYAVPWQYWNIRDVRTIVALGRSLLDIDPKKDMPFNGTEHNALDDAVHQAQYVCEIYSRFDDKRQHTICIEPPKILRE